MVAALGLLSGNCGGALSAPVLVDVVAVLAVNVEVVVGVGLAVALAAAC